MFRVQDDDARTALHWACYNGNKKTLLHALELRHEAASCGSATDTEGRCNGCCRALRALSTETERCPGYHGYSPIQEGAIASGDQGMTAIHWAAMKGHEQVPEHGICSLQASCREWSAVCVREPSVSPSVTAVDVGCNLIHSFLWQRCGSRLLADFA